MNLDPKIKAEVTRDYNETQNEKYCRNACGVVVFMPLATTEMGHLHGRRLVSAFTSYQPVD